MMTRIYTLITCMAIAFAQNCLGQTTTSLIKKESFSDLKDETMRKEISSFGIKASSAIQADTFPGIKLQEIQLKGCSDKHAYFDKGNIYDTELVVSVEAGEDGSVASVYLRYGRYGDYRLPNSALANINHPRFCESHTKKGKPIKSSCKVFRSEDKRRVYIYMLNGDGENRYEVIWILQDKKYYGRVIDTI